MKETVNVNIGSVAFTLDRDAYRVLGSYFDDIRRRLPETDTETMSDIEGRVAEIFSEKIHSPMQVVTLEAVRMAMAQMGSPADFGEPRKTAQASEGEAWQDPQADQTDTDARPPVHKLYRSRTHRSIAGVCGGLGDYFDADPTMIRLLMLLLILFGGLSIWAYIILWIVIPEEPARKFRINNKRR